MNGCLQPRAGSHANSRMKNFRRLCLVLLGAATMGILRAQIPAGPQPTASISPLQSSPEPTATITPLPSASPNGTQPQTNNTVTPTPSSSSIR